MKYVDEKTKTKVHKNGVIEILDDDYHFPMDESTIPFPSNEAIAPLKPLSAMKPNALQNFQREKKEISTQTQPNIVLKKDMSTQTRPVNETVHNECPVCFDETEYPWTIPCGHIFCPECLVRIMQTRRRCPLCKRKFHMNEMHDLYFNLI